MRLFKVYSISLQKFYGEPGFWDDEEELSRRLFVSPDGRVRFFLANGDFKDITNDCLIQCDLQWSRFEDIRPKPDQKILIKSKGKIYEGSFLDAVDAILVRGNFIKVEEWMSID